MADVPFFIFALIALVWLTTTYREVFRTRKRLPPGPQGVPFLGNKHQVPPIKPWRKFEEWNKQYGKFFVLQSGDIVVIDVDRTCYLASPWEDARHW